MIYNSVNDIDYHYRNYVIHSNEWRLVVSIIIFIE